MTEEERKQDEENRRLQRDHLGDGVYASFDGYRVNLAVNHHGPDHVIALGPHVVRAMVDYFKRVGAFNG